MLKTTIDIKGMHCRSCELLIEDELYRVKGVYEVKVSHTQGKAHIYHREQLKYSHIAQAVKKAGYEMGKEAPKPWFTQDQRVYIESAIMALILFILFYIANDAGLVKLADFGSNNFASLPVVFMVGLAAGLSTCAALVGGLVLGASARYSQKYPDASPLEKFKPHIFFNIGRVISFFVFGGVIGLVGSFFQMSLTTMGFLTIIAGMVMLFFGAQLTEMFPRLSSIHVTLAPSIAKALGLKEQTEKEYSHKNSFILGALTFFLPCGFTQVVQLYAISTGNPLAGALTMGVFALGTAPGLLGIGGITAVVKGAFAKTFFRFAGITVIALALFNITNGINLSGIKNMSFTPAVTQVLGQSISADVQVIKATYDSVNDLQPNKFTVKVGQPVRFEIDVREDGFGCMGSMALPGLSRQIEVLEKGKSMVFAFTPQKTGNYSIACAMGIPRGSISVI